MWRSHELQPSVAKHGREGFLEDAGLFRAAAGASVEHSPAPAPPHWPRPSQLPSRPYTALWEAGPPAGLRNDRWARLAGTGRAVMRPPAPEPLLPSCGELLSRPGDPTEHLARATSAGRSSDVWAWSAKHVPCVPLRPPSWTFGREQVSAAHTAPLTPLGRRGPSGRAGALTLCLQVFCLKSCC